MAVQETGITSFSGFDERGYYTSAKIAEDGSFVLSSTILVSCGGGAICGGIAGVLQHYNLTMSGGVIAGGISPSHFIGPIGTLFNTTNTPVSFTMTPYNPKFTRTET